MISRALGFAVLTLIPSTLMAEDLPNVVKDTANAVVVISWKSADGGELHGIYARPEDQVLLFKGQAGDVQHLGRAIKDLTVTAKPSTTFACGTLVSADGMIVIPGPSTLPANVADIEVKLPAGGTFPAKRLVVDYRNDLSLLKIEPKTTLEFLNLEAANVEVGEPVVGVYRSANLETIASVGIVAGKNRTVGPNFNRLLQTELQLGPGGSGSPVVNREGQLVGIATATMGDPASRTSFAVPARHVRTLVESVDASGMTTLKRAYMGVSLAATPAGEVLVNAVAEGSGAEKAGMQPDDIILEVGGTQVATVDDLMARVNQLDVDQEVRVRIRRGDQEYELPVTLSSRSTKSPSGKVTMGRVQPGEVIAFSTESVPTDEGSERALNWLVHRAAGKHPQPTTLRVQRTDHDERMEEIEQKIESLRADVQELTDTMRRLEKRLGE